MAEYEYSVDIAATPEQVWSVMSDVERWPEWTASVTEAKLLDTGVLRVGSEVLLRQPRLAAARWIVDDLEPGRQFTWSSTAPGLTSRGFHGVTSSATGSHVQPSLVQRGPLAFLSNAFYGRLIRTYVRLEGDGLKRRTEQRHEP